MKKLLLLLLLILAAYLFWRWWRSDAGVAKGQELFYDRLWVDHMPAGDTDTIRVMAAVTQQPIGIFQSASQWKGEYELFRYEARADGQLEIVYPQTRGRDKVKYRAWRCKERSFDFCLEIEGASRGTKRYYSLDGWEIGSRSLDEARADAAKLLPATEPQQREQ